MEREKLKIIYAEKDGKPTSYQYLERSESERIKKILEIIPNLKSWTQPQIISNHIGEKRIATTQAIYKLAGAKKLIIDGRIIAEHPIILLRKERYNPKNNLQEKKYLRPPIHIKCPHC